MRYRIHAWMVLAGLWAGDARSLEPGGLDDPLAHATSCVEAVAALAAAPEVAAAREAHVEAICAAEAAQLRHDPETEAALEQWHRANTAAITLHVRELMASSDPRDQLAAAMIAPIAEPVLFSGEEFDWTTEESTVAFTAARRLGPDDRLVAWMEALDCPRARAGSGCDPEAALLRLQRMEPDNAAVWIKALDRTVEDGDAAAVDRMLSQAANATRYEIPLGEIGLLLFETFQAVDGPPMPPRVASALGLDTGLGRPVTTVDNAEIQAMSLAIAIALPAYHPLQQVCTGEEDKPALAHRVPTCIAIYTQMAQDPSLISQSIALTSLVRLTADAAAGTDWRERLREMNWVMSEGTKILSAAAPEGYLQSLWRDGEMVALESVLSAAGIPTKPPPGWLPDHERHRALITTGRYPAGP